MRYSHINKIFSLFTQELHLLISITFWLIDLWHWNDFDDMTKFEMARDQQNIEEFWKKKVKMLAFQENLNLNTLYKIYFAQIKNLDALLRTSNNNWIYFEYTLESKYISLLYWTICRNLNCKLSKICWTERSEPNRHQSNLHTWIKTLLEHPELMHLKAIMDFGIKE